MRTRSILFAAAAVLLAACTPRAPAPVPLQLAIHERNQPIDQSCHDLMAQAARTQARGGFGLLKREVAQVIGPAAPDVSVVAGQSRRPGVLVPAGSHPVELLVPVFDNTFTRMYVDCTAHQAWFSKRGGVIDRTVWFGPFALAPMPP